MRIAFIIIALLAIIVIRGAFYVVQEPEQVIITQFGKPVGDPVTIVGSVGTLPLPPSSTATTE